MQIKVNGNSIKKYMPDTIVINLVFSSSHSTQEETLKIGLKNVDNFVQNVIIKNGLDKDIIKCENYNMIDDYEYDGKSKKYLKKGYKFIQNAEIKIAYDLEVLHKLLEYIATYKESIVYSVHFELSDVYKYRDDLIEDAIQDARKKALSIAKVTNKKLIDILEIDYTDNVPNGTMRLAENMDMTNNLLLPNEIEVYISLTGTFIAE